MNQVINTPPVTGPHINDPHLLLTTKFEKGIRARNVELVRQTLKAGVYAGTRVDGLHPLQALLYQEYGDFDAEGRPVKPGTFQATVNGKKEFNAQGSRILNLLLEHGVDLLEEQRSAVQDRACLADLLLLSQHGHDVVTVVIHAIQQSLQQGGKVYQPHTGKFITSFLKRLGAEISDINAVIAFNFLQTVHETVRLRFEDPRSKIEMDIVDRYGDKIGFWVNDLKAPVLTPVFGRQVRNVNTTTNQGDARSKAETAAGNKMSQHVKVLEKKTPAQVLAEIDAMIGMEDVKREARSLWVRSQWDAARAVNGEPEVSQVLHTALVGNPGTGKTVSARLRAELLHALGLAGNKYIEISRENMVGGFIGHTEENMVALFKEADIIFIDEAYNLAGEKEDSNDFGKRVVDALMIALENPKKPLVVFFAGYPHEMKKFLASNPGLQSRIPHLLPMPDYSLEELGQILDLNLAKAGLKIETEAQEYVLAQLKTVKQARGPRDFGNARDVRTIVQQLPNQMAMRLFDENEESVTGLVVVPSKEALSTVTKADVEALGLVKKLGASAEPHKNQYGFLRDINNNVPTQ